jgi:hypothetical protein
MFRTPCSFHHSCQSLHKLGWFCGPKADWGFRAKRYMITSRTTLSCTHISVRFWEMLYDGARSNVYEDVVYEK